MRAAAAAPRVAAALLVLLLVGGATPAGATLPGGLEQARQAAEQLRYDGVIDVQWWDGTATKVQKLTVHGTGGTVIVDGGNAVMARSPFERLVANPGHAWEEFWLPSLAPGPRPQATPKYEIAEIPGGPMVAGRSTRTIEIRRQGAVRERCLLDNATSLLLRRDQYDTHGTVLRTVAFESVAIPGATADTARPSAPSGSAPRPADLRHLSPATAPAVVGDGYQRVGVFQAGDVLHVLYSDGVYDLSLFQQAGRVLGRDMPPSAERVDLGTATGWRSAWPGGQLLVWSDRGTVFTAVSDGPAEEILQAVRSLPDPPDRRLSLVGKLRRASEALMEPLL